MKKLRLIPIIAALPLFMASCVIMEHHVTTGNPIGTKEGIVKSKLVGNFDGGIGAAAKQGGITKIGSVDIYLLSTGKFIVKVTGE